MFRIILSCVSHLWDLLCESFSPTTDSHTPSSSSSESTASTSDPQTPSSSSSESVASTTDPQTASSSVSGSTPTTPYDVFLSFRGEDTRLNFTGHLYDKLDSNGIRTFMDDPELPKGEVISDALLDAIRKSKTHIVVLSENYASSSWCLDELAEILICHKTMQRSVIPVFYKTEPSVVRRLTGSFEQAFKKHQVRFADEMEKVNNWKLTLKEVADFSGYHISKNRSEADVINEIVNELLVKINPKTLDVTKYPVGLDARVKSITTLLSSDTEGVIKFGIYGMGGVGKTTLARALFNQLVSGGRFKGSCFLADVRENSRTTKGLVSLQMQLINDVLCSTTKVKFHNVAQGINHIRTKICSAKILVVIDDIYDREQYEYLAGPFASGSVVIITTRDEEMLDEVDVGPKYRYLLKELNDAQSRELFTKYAFEKAEPHNNLLALSKDILFLAGGLPLALKIFGSYLSTKEEVGWKSYIKTLQQNPNNTIQQKLLISLDTLESDDLNLKKIFVDIACFFIGWNKEQAVKVLETYYSHADYKMDTLKKRCLLTMNENKLEMHDLLRDVGRNVARNNAPDEPGKYSRLWLPKDITDVLRSHEGTEAIEGIISSHPSIEEDALRIVNNAAKAFQDAFLGESLSTKTFQDANIEFKLELELGTEAIECIIFEYEEEEFDYEEEEFELEEVGTETFKRMRRLRFLSLRNVNLTGSFKCIPDDLRWLRWEHCPLECLPSEFYPQKLVVLELPNSKMRELNMVSNVFEKLKALSMSNSKDLTTTPDFTKLPSLETLDLHGCESLEEVDISKGSLRRLVSINLHGCPKLRSLPNNICDLRALEVLDISRCNSLEALPIQLGNIISLTKLNAEGLKVLKLPDSIGHLSKLVELDLSNNKKLETLPDTICNLRALEILNIYECEKLVMLPDELWKITRLRNLDAGGTKLLKKLPDIGSSEIALSLQKLDLSWSGITALPSGFSQLSNLQYLDIGGCLNLFSIPKLPPNLKLIYVYYSELLPNLSDCKHLETVGLSDFSGSTQLQRVTPENIETIFLKHSG